MAISSVFPTAHLTIRSISLPSRIESEVPNSQKVESLLQNLRSFQISCFNTKTPPFGFEKFQTSLVDLAELYNSLGTLLQSSTTQQALLHYQQAKIVEEALNESVVLIDSCSTARDIVLMMKEYVQILQSALRRKATASNIESHACAYFSFRRKARKDIQKCLILLKQMENNKPNSHLLDLESPPVIRLLTEARTISISIFGDILAFLSVPVTKAKGKAIGWSLISQWMPVISSNSEKREKMINEVESVDFALHSLLKCLRNNSNDNKIEAQIAQRWLGRLAANSEGIESKLDNMFRCLVKHRVCFLNMLTH